MNTRLIGCSFRSRGITLVEVLAATVLLGSILAALVMAKGRHTRQWLTAQRKLDAIAATDDLLTQWWQTPDSIPHHEEDEVANHDTWRWRTEPVENQQAAELGLKVIRLDIVDTALQGESRALTSVEFVVPEEIPTESEPMSEESDAP